MADASMLELYLSKVPDPELQAQLRAEIERTTTKFGLVFERHQPEGIRMPKAPIRRGSKVVDEGTGTFHRVLAIDGEEAELVDADGTRTRQQLDGLTVAREFGDVMYPGLQPVHAIRRGKPSDPVHTVINGENYHALEMLQYTHANRVDLIYIDPPYNTGNKTWKYNDRYISEQDGYRHSKWLSFMEKRLKIARTLLKSTGVIIVAIGDEEHHRLRMLLDQVFGEQNFISDVVWQGGRKNDSRYVSNGADYMLIYGRDERALSEADVRWNEPRSGLEEIREAARSAWEESGHKQADATRIMKRWIAGLPEGHPAKENNRFYEFEPDGRVFRKKDISWPGGGGPRYDVIHPVTGKPVRVPSRGWIYSKPERMQQDIDAGLIFWGKDHTEFINRKTYLDEGPGIVPTSVFERKRTSAGKGLEAILGDQRFPYPKDTEVLMRWIRLVAPADAVVLDFFGGSGTTAEAVMRLNVEDGGTRQCVLVTNNELAARDDARLRKDGFGPGDDEYEALGVFRHVTMPRIETVVTGVREDGSAYSDGLAASVAFFELEYLDEARIDSGLEFDALSSVFWLRAGAVGEPVRRETLKQGYAVSQTSNTAVLFKPAKAAELAQILADGDFPNLTHLFIVSDSEEQGNTAKAQLPGDLAVERIYGSYLTAFQINRKG